MWRRWAGRHPTGIDRVCLAYLEHFGRDAQAVIQHRRIRKILDGESSSVLFDLLAKPSRNFRRALAGQAIRFGLRTGCDGRGRIYLNVGHTGLNDDGFRTWVRRTGVRPVYFVHDLIPIAHPELCRSGEREKHVERMRTVLTTAVGVIANSQATLDELSDFSRSEGIRSSQSISALLGTEPMAASKGHPEPAQPTFVIVGTIEARKNHLMLLQVWSRLVRRLGSVAPRLLVIGQRGWECEQVLDLLDRSELLKGVVVEIDRCDDATLVGHLAHARALLFPSLAEGYGLPLIEALQAGTPVIASDLSVFRELAGDVPDYLDPLDGPAWERAILDYSQDSSARRARQLERIASHRTPTWQDHFDVVDPWLTKL